MGRRESGKRRRAKRDATEYIGVQLRLSFGLLESLLSISGSEGKDPVSGPTGQQAEHVADVAERLDVVQTSTGEERNESRVGLGAVFASQEQPVSALMQSSA
jgi:hypothetical protein